MTSYVKELKNNGISFNLLRDKIREYESKNFNSNLNEHKIDLTKNISVRIKFKDFKKLPLESDEHKNTLKDVVTASIYSGKKKIKSLDTTQFVNDFSKELRSLGTVYIIGDPDAVPLVNAGSSVKAQIRTDFVQSLLSGLEGSIPSDFMAGDSNIPLQSIADVFAVMLKSIGYSQLGIDEISPVPTTYNTLQSINKTSVYQIKRILGYSDDPFDGSGAGVDNDLVLSYADGGLVPVFQLYYHNGNVTNEGYVYMRRRIAGTTSTSITWWSRIVNQDLMNASIELGTRPIVNFLNQINLQIKPTVGVLLSESNSNGYPITSVRAAWPCYIGNGQIVYVNYDDGHKLYLKKADESNNGIPITSVGSSYPCYIGNDQLVYSSNSRLNLKSATGTDNGIPITTVNGTSSCYVGNGKIAYTNNSNQNFIYLKSATTLDNGVQINNANSFRVCYVGNGQIIYTNVSDGSRLYIKNINESGNGYPITNEASDYSFYIGGYEIGYIRNSDNLLYLKSIKTNSTGININSVPTSLYIAYVGNGRIIYRNNSNGLLYNKNLFDYR